MDPLLALPASCNIYYLLSVSFEGLKVDFRNDLVWETPKFRNLKIEKQQIEKAHAWMELRFGESKPECNE